MGIKTSKGVLGSISGTVGTVVLSRWRGLEIAKSLPVSNKNKKVSEAKADQNQLFALVRKFLTFDEDGIFNVSFPLPGNSKFHPKNAVTSYHMLHAVVGAYPDYSIDLSKMKFSQPVKTTENGWNAVFTGEERVGLTIKWELNPYPKKSTQLDDEAVIVAFDTKQNKLHLLTTSAQRHLLTYTMPFKNAKKKHEFYCWMFFVSKDKKLVSETEYLGMVTMMA